MSGSATSRRVRRPAVAGTFYPADPEVLRSQVDGLLADAGEAARRGTERRIDGGPDGGTLGGTDGGMLGGTLGVAPKAVIAPHAGYRYSGAVAAAAYAQLAPRRRDVRRVVLVGPAHRVAVRALGTTSADAWRTPLGLVDIDHAARDRVLAHPAVELADRALAPEHSLEVHVPFLQRLLAPGWTLLPLIVGRAEPESVADVLDLVWGGDETAVVVSTDLSHYHDHDTATGLDLATTAAIVARSTDIGPRDACGAYPVRGLLRAAHRHDLDVELLDRCTSGDRTGDRSRVVGYASFALRPVDRRPAGAPADAPAAAR